jgi:hypothetical protein
MNNVLIDYAMPLMNIERMTKKVHDLCLVHKYEEARELSVHLTVESRLLATTLRHMGEQEKRSANS